MYYYVVMKNSENRFRTLSGVLILVTRKTKNGDTEYLLQRRQNTGFADGMWDFSASGHVDEAEPMTKTVCREAKEEIGIEVDPQNVEFMGLFHYFRTDNEPMFLACFKVADYSGEIKIGEPDKVAELGWFSKNNLPDDTIESRRLAIDYYEKGDIFYHEYGWERRDAINDRQL